MSIDVAFVPAKSRLRALLEHFAVVEDPRERWRVAHPLPEVLLLVVCGTIADCDDYEGIADWGETHLAFLRRLLPYHHGVPGARWLTVLMNRIDPALFSAAFTAWVRETWPDAATSLPSTARPRGAAMIAAPVRRRFTSSPLSRPPAAWCSARRRSRTRAMRSPPFRS